MFLKKVYIKLIFGKVPAIRTIPHDAGFSGRLCLMRALLHFFSFHVWRSLSSPLRESSLST